MTASVANYLAAPAVSGKVKALSVISGTTVCQRCRCRADARRRLDRLLRRRDRQRHRGEGSRARRRSRQAPRRSSSPPARRRRAASPQRWRAPTTVVVKGGDATLDRLTLGVGGGSVQVTGTAGQPLNLDVQLSALPATVVNAFAPGVDATGAISGSARISGAAAKPDIGYQLELEECADGADARRRLRRDEHQLERHFCGRRAEVHRQCRRRLRPRHEGRRHGRHRGDARCRSTFPGRCRSAS